MELKEGGGEIYVNGRYVEQLLLNGKDFFDSDRQLMLDNLPSFMVKGVKVYDKESDLDKYAGTKVKEKKLVMDVNLKKQYHIGTIVNVEAGGGTENRYMGRLFAMRFTPRSRLVAVGNINNLNDNRRPGQNTSWTPENMPTGTFTNKLGGIDYQFEDELSGFKWRTEFTGKHTSSYNYSEQSNEQFLSGGNTFGRSLSTGHSGSTQLYLSNRLDIHKEKIQWSGDLWGNFYRNDSRSGSASATFSGNPELYAGGHSDKETALHRLERLDGWGEDTQNAIGTLPSETEWAMEQTYDNRNSSIERLDPQRHELAATLQYEHEEDNNLWQANAILPLNINIQNVYHRRYTYDRHTRVKHVFVNPSFSLWRIWDNRKKQWRINYSINTQVPDFIGQLLDFPNDNDPLNVATGNPDLKPAVTHNWKILLQLNNGEKHRMFSASTSFNTTANAIARGFTYNPATGARYYRPEDVRPPRLFRSGGQHRQTGMECPPVAPYRKSQSHGLDRWVRPAAAAFQPHLLHELARTFRNLQQRLAGLLHGARDIQVQQAT